LTLHQNSGDQQAMREAGPAPHADFLAAAALAGYTGDYAWSVLQLTFERPGR
jgi:hypothetical protein